MRLPETFSENKNVNAVIECPKGSGNKFTYNKENDFFSLTKVLPSGTSFPLDFGFIPHTLAADGDPLDILVVSEFPTFTGCIIESRIIGAMLCEQKEKKQKPYRNDRIIAVANESLIYSDLHEIVSLNKNHLNEIIHFFEYYNQMRGKKFKFLRSINKKKTMQLIKQHIKNY